MNDQHKKRRKRHVHGIGVARPAMSLVELLVVITVILVVVAAAIPAIRPAIQDGYLREASRQLNIFVVAAQARAAQLNREVGIRFVRSSAGADSCTEVFVVESPPPYSGDFLYARATFSDFSSPLDGIVDGVTFADNKSQLVNTLIKPGDTIRFDYKGPIYRVTGVSVNGSSQPVVSFVSQTGSSSVLPPSVGVSVPYQIFRQPVRAGVRPLQLPSGSCVDLQNSGHGATLAQFFAKNDLTVTPNIIDGTAVDIVFRPRGGISRLYYGSVVGSSVIMTQFTPVGSVYLLVGRFEQAPPSPLIGGTIDRSNLEDPAVTWLAISDQDGRCTVGENDSTGTDLATARAIVRSGQVIGGR